jgi:hypothetical protein
VAAEVLEWRQLLTGTAAVNALVVSSADGSIYGRAVALTAAVAPAASTTTYPTGTVTFKIDGVARAAVALHNGVASFSISTLSVGAHSVVATYSGDAIFAPTTSPVLTQNVGSTFTPPWHPTDVIDVTKFGVKGDGVTDNTAALQNLINQIAPTITSQNPTSPDVFYFPAGTYLVRGALDFSKLPDFGIMGAVNANGQPLSIIKGTATSGTLVTANTGGGTFQVWNMKFQASNAGQTAFYANYSVMSTFENCVFSGHIGLDLYDGFSTALRNDKFTGAGGAQGSSIGLLEELPTNAVVSDCDFSGWSEGLRVSGTGLSVVRSTFEKNGIGARLGADSAGNNWAVGRSSFDNLTFSANDVGIFFQVAAGCSFCDINIVGTATAPSGQSKYGFTGGAVGSSIFSNIHVSGGFADAGANMAPSFLNKYAIWTNTSLYGSWATNSISSGQAWVTQLTPLSATDVAAGKTQATVNGAVLTEATNIDNVTAANTVAAPQGAVHVLNVTQYGVVGDGTTDDTAKLQALINSAKAGAIFYFPKGTYRVSSTIDFSALPNFSIIGDLATNGGNSAASVIIGDVAGALIKADYGSKGGTYRIRNVMICNQSSDSNSCGLFSRNSILSSIQDASILGGYFGMEQINPFMLAVRTVCVSGSIGLMISGGMGSTVEDMRGLGMTEGLRVGGATDFALFDADLEVNGIAIDLGLDPSGNAAVVTGASILGLSLEANGIGFDVKSCTRGFFAAIGSQGHTNAATPNLIDTSGLLVEDGAQNCTFAADGFGGYYVAGPAVEVTSGASNLLFIDCAAWNGNLTGLTNPAVWDIESTNDIVLSPDI